MLDLLGASQGWRSFFPLGSFLLLAHQDWGTVAGFVFPSPSPTPSSCYSWGKISHIREFLLQKDLGTSANPLGGLCVFKFYLQGSGRNKHWWRVQWGFSPFLGKMLLINASGPPLKCWVSNVQVFFQVRGLLRPLFFLPINPGLQPLFILMGLGPPVPKSQLLSDYFLKDTTTKKKQRFYEIRMWYVNFDIYSWSWLVFQKTIKNEAPFQYLEKGLRWWTPKDGQISQRGVLPAVGFVLVSQDFSMSKSMTPGSWGVWFGRITNWTVSSILIPS